MELLVLFIIGLLIAIGVLPFVALAKANGAKRGVDDLVTRLSTLENEVRNLRPEVVPILQPESLWLRWKLSCYRFQSQQPLQSGKRKYRCRRQFPKDSSKKPFLKSQRPPDHRLIGSNSWARNSSRGSAGSRFSSAWRFS